MWIMIGTLWLVLGINWDSGVLIGICKVTKPWLALNYGMQAVKHAHSGGDPESLESMSINLDKTGLSGAPSKINGNSYRMSRVPRATRASCH